MSRFYWDQIIPIQLLHFEIDSLLSSQNSSYQFLNVYLKNKLAKLCNSWCYHTKHSNGSFDIYFEIENCRSIGTTKFKAPIEVVGTVSMKTNHNINEKRNSG